LKMKKYYIGLIGTHGTGKTTYANRLIKELARQYPERDIALISGIARQCPFPVNKKTQNRRFTPDAGRALFEA